jgi:hypothetical protein
MDEGPILLSADAVTIGVETPLRMKVDAHSIAEPLVAALPRTSAVPAYSSPLSFDWRRDEPMAAIKR